MVDVSEEKLPVIVGIRFSKIGKNYYFDASKLNDTKAGDFVVVETSRGWQLGELVEIINDPELLKNASYKSVDRLATVDDMKKKEELDRKSDSALQECREQIRNQKLNNLKAVSAEFSFDEKILSFLVACEAEEMPNINQVKKNLNKRFPNIRIDFHKIGPRDVAKYYGGMGACGLPKRCCSKFLKQFESISIRMAKTQGISLTPADITGMCDRLRCCLGYEHCQYVEALKNMPKRNKNVMTPLGSGKIRDLAPLRECVYVQLEEMGVKEFHIGEIEEIKPIREMQKPQQQERERNFQRKRRNPSNRKK